MQPTKYETINPHITTKTIIYTEVIEMDDLRFPNRPDETLRGTRFLKRQMIPDDENSDNVSLPRDSFLWKSDVLKTDDFNEHFDSKSFLKSHAHLLPESDNSQELEKNLRNRRLRIASSAESRAGQGFTSTDETNTRMELQSPYDELTYEETLFEVDDDRIHARSVTSHDDEESELASMNRSMVLGMNRRKRQKINNKDFENSFSMAASKNVSNHSPQRKHMQPQEHEKHGSHRKFFNDSTNERIALQAKHQKTAHIDQESNNDIIPEDLLEKYIEERIRAVEMQIRDEVMRDSQNLKRHPYHRGFNEFKLLDKVPEQYSIELEQADESSRDSLLKEIAAILVSKGYVANSDSPKLPREIFRMSKNTGKNQENKAKYDTTRKYPLSKQVSNNKVDPKKYLRELRASPPSTFRSQKESSGQPTSIESEKSYLKCFGNRTNDGFDARRRKLKSSGSRSSLTSLIRTPDSSSSSEENTVRRKQVKRSLSSSKKSSEMSNNSSKATSESKTEKKQNPYDNIIFRNGVSQINIMQEGIRAPNMIYSKPVNRQYEFNNLGKIDGNLPQSAEDKISVSKVAKESRLDLQATGDQNSKAENANLIEIETGTRFNSIAIDVPEICPAPPSSGNTYRSSNPKSIAETDSNLTFLTVLDTSPPAPPPRKKSRSASAVSDGPLKPKLSISFSLENSHDNEDGLENHNHRTEPLSANSVLHGDRSASEFFVLDNHATGMV